LALTGIYENGEHGLQTKRLAIQELTSLLLII